MKPWRLLSAGMLAAAAAHADPQPYQTLPDTPSDRGIVRAFFLFSCPHCREADPLLSRWGKSLPSTMAYAKTPVVVQSGESVVGAIAYYTALVTNPERIQLFSDTSYRLIQQDGYSAQDRKTYDLAARQAGYNSAQYRAHWGNPEVKRLFMQAAMLTASYNIRMTPTLTIGGRYSISPEVVAGNASSFVQLSNAMVSKYLQDGSPSLRPSLP